MAHPVILLETSSGEILIELFEDKAPKTVANFLEYVDEGFYTNTIFHRVIPEFMIQGGGLTLQMKEKKAHAPIKNEATDELKNLKGTVAMARSADPHSATCQFYINTVDNPELDNGALTSDTLGYCVFGQVIEGLDVAEKISKLKTKAVAEHEDVPIDMVVITGVSRYE